MHPVRLSYFDVSLHYGTTVESVHRPIAYQPSKSGNLNIISKTQKGLPTDEKQQAVKTAANLVSIRCSFFFNFRTRQANMKFESCGGRGCVGGYLEKSPRQMVLSRGYILRKGPGI